MIKNNKKSLRSVDLNLLPILRELLHEQNVSRAAERLFMTQPSVSEALGRLRLQFGDEILVRAGRKMLITPFAKELIEPLNEILTQIESLGTDEEDFSVADIEREFTIATADSALLALGRGLVTDLAEHMPKVQVQITDLRNFDVRDLKAGDIDIAIIPKNFVEGDGLNSLYLYQEDFVCISRKNHPGISGQLNQNAIKNLPKVGFRPDQNSPIRVLSPPGWDEQLLVPQLTMLPYLVEKSDSIALTQRRVAEYYSTIMDIEIHELGNFTWAIDVCAYWGHIYENDRVHMCLRNRLQDMLT